MNPTDFIFKNITELLVKDGYSRQIALASANAGVDEYYQRSCPTQKGKIFDDCLVRAKKHAKGLIKSTH